MALLQSYPVLETAYAVKSGQSVSKYTLVKQDGTNEDEILGAGAGEKVLGVAQEDGSGGDVIRVMLLGISPVKAADGAVSLGDGLVPDASGKADGARGSEDNICARALGSSTAEDELIPAFLGSAAGTGKRGAKTYVYCQSSKAGADFPADITASVADETLFVAEEAGTIEDVIVYADNTGTDASNALEIEADVDIGGSSCLTTLPKITKAAADRSNSKAGGAGVTGAAIDTAANTLTAGDRVSVDLNLTRTASPTDEMAGVIVQVVVNYG